MGIRRAMNAAEWKQLFTLDGLKTLLGHKRSDEALELIERRMVELEGVYGCVLAWDI
jgi:hypothetical protein